MKNETSEVTQLIQITSVSMKGGGWNAPLNDRVIFIMLCKFVFDPSNHHATDQDINTRKGSQNTGFKQFMPCKKDCCGFNIHMFQIGLFYVCKHSSYSDGKGNELKSFDDSRMAHHVKRS